MQYLFPYSAVAQNSRVVIYGAGNVGHDYVRQINKNGFCNIILWVDKEPKEACVRPLEELKQLSADDYDFILLATVHDTYIREMRHFLIANNLPENKILNVNPTEIEPESFNEIFIKQYDSKVTVEQFINSISAQQEVLRNYFLKAGGHIAYFHSLIKELQTRCLDDAEQKRLLTVFSDILTYIPFSKKAELVLLRILYLGNCFCSQFLERFVDCIFSSDFSTEDKLFLWQDATMMYLTHSKHLYKEFFKQKKALGAHIAKSFPLHISDSGYKKNFQKNRLVVTQIMYPDYPPMKLTMPLLKRLSAFGYEVHIIDLGAFEYDLGNCLFEPLFNPQESAAKFQDYYQDYSNIYYPAGNTMLERFQNILNHIMSLHPALIIDVSDEYSILPYYFVKQFPVLYWPMKRPSSGSYFHKIVMQPEFYAKSSQKIEHPFSLEQCVSIPPSFEKIVLTGRYSRKDFSLSSDDVVMITVGNRISVEMSPGLQESVCQILKKNKKLKWFIVGCAVLPFIATSYSELIQTQIKFISYEQHLPDLLAICDIYLNPYRLGGGTSMAWACQAGLALATPRGGGNIAGYAFAGDTFSVPTEDDLAPYILELMNDKSLFNKNRSYMKAKVNSFDVDLAASQFKTEIDRLIKEYYSER